MANNAFVFIPPSNTGLPGGIPTANTIEYFEKGIDEQGPYYLVQYYINNWSDSDTFINALLGYTTNSGSGTGGVVKTSPHQYPLSKNLLCRRARAIAPGCAKLGSSGLPDFYGGALIQAEYRAPLWQAYPNTQEQIDPATPLPFCTQELEHTVETYTVPGSMMYYAGTTTLTNQPFRIRVPVTNLTLTFHLSPNLYIATNSVRAMRGYVNSTTFLGAAAGCVLFKGGRTTRNYDAAGNVVQDIVLTFAERSPGQPWNALPKPGNNIGAGPSGAWATVDAVSNGTSNPPYPSGDFNTFIYGF